MARENRESSRKYAGRWCWPESCPLLQHYRQDIFRVHTRNSEGKRRYRGIRYKGARESRNAICHVFEKRSVKNEKHPCNTLNDLSPFRTNTDDHGWLHKTLCDQNKF